MDLKDNLIESGHAPKKRGWKASATSIVLHGLLVVGIVYAGQNVKHQVDSEKPIAAFISQGAAPPPPPPPPPPPKSGGGAKAQPRVQPQPEPQTPPPDPLTPPTEIPQEVPKVDLPITQDLPVVDTPMPESTGGPLTDGPGDALNGVVGGVEGGVAGGVVGGEVGGQIGGQIGGEIGGVVGGVLGGQVGGTGTGTGGEGTGGETAPMRVGGDVKAPVIVNRAEPNYTEAARKARVSGIVIVEAIIDKNGNVNEVKVVKGLPLGLAEEAANAVRKWKFRPGTHNGRPVATIFNLTVNLKLD